MRSNVPRCIAAHAVVFPTTHHIVASFGVGQHAISKPSSADTIVCKLHNHMKATPQHAVVQLDATNTFSGIERQLAFEALGRGPIDLVVAASQYMSRPSIGVFQIGAGAAKMFEHNTGMTQGDPLSAAVFAFAL